MSAISMASFFRFSLQLIIAELFFLKGKSREHPFGWRAAFSVCGYIVLGSIVHLIMHGYMPDVMLTQIVYWISLFVMSMIGIAFCYDLMFIEVLFIGSGGYAMEHIAYSVDRMLRYLFFRDIEINVWVDNLVFRCLLYLAVYGLIYYIVIYPNKNKGEFRQRDTRLLKILLSIIFSAIILSVISAHRDIVGESYILSEIICPLYSLLCCFLALVIEYYVLRENRLNHEKEMMEQILQMARTQQKSSREAIDIINIKCHDLKHQMKILLTLDDPSERMEYLEEMKRAISIYDATYHTGCIALDYLLREKTLLCEEYGVEFSCMAEGEHLNFISATDIYALVGNAMDNAIEAVCGAHNGDKIISLRIQKKASMIALHMENTCDYMPDFVDGLPVTTKPDKDYHGFGVKSIAYIVEKYNGQFRMKADAGKFYLDVLIPVHE